MAVATATESVFATTVFVFLGAATSRLLAFTKIPYSVLLLVRALVRVWTEFKKKSSWSGQFLRLQLWGLAIGVGDKTFTRSWQHLGTGVAWWQVPQHATSLSVNPQQENDCSVC